MIESLNQIDHKLFFILNSWHADWLNSSMVLFSGQAIWLPFVVIILLLAFKQLGRTSFFVFLLFLVLAIIASDVTSSYLLKNLVQRMRPCRISELKLLINDFGQKCGGKFGFVSSHAANSFCIMIFSFSILQIKSKALHLLWFLPLIVSYSRIYLGVHYPGDIVGGILVGSTWGLVLAWYFKNQSGRQTT